MIEQGSKPAKASGKSLWFADNMAPDSVLRRRTSLSSSWIVSCQDGTQQHRKCFSYLYADRTSVSRLLFYTPPATLVRLLATNATIVWLTSYVLYLSGASDDPRMLLPAWVSIATVRPRSALLALKHGPDASSSDTDGAIPSHAAQNKHSERDFGLDQRLLHCEFHQHVFLATAVTLGTRQ